jgi:transposase
LFETFALAVLAQVPAIAKAARLLKLSWDETLAIKKLAVARGLMRRTFETTQYLGLDEKSFGRNERFITVLSDIHGERVLEVAPSKSMAAAIATLSVLPDATRAEIDAVVMDMAAAYENACAAMLPNAEIVYDRYHIEQLLTGAVDKVRRAEHKHLMREGITVLKNSRYLWLRRPERWSEAQEAQYRDIARDFGAARLSQSKLGRAWAIKESFRWFWGYVYPGWAKRYFARWYFWATHSRIPHVITVARTLKERLDGLLNYFHHGITNAFAEGINSKIQDLKSAARGFRSFENYRVSILFSCGRLSMQP